MREYSDGWPYILLLNQGSYLHFCDVFPERLRQKNLLREILCQKSHFLFRGMSGGPKATAIPHYHSKSGHFKLGGFEIGRKLFAEA